MSGYLLNADKTYEAVFRLGVTTTTGDAEGEILETRDVGVLERFIPAMAHARGLLPLDQYHKYTVDEHSLRAVRWATDLFLDMGPLGRAYRRISRKHVLHLALLIHDLGKGFGEDHSKLGRKIARQTARRLGLNPTDTKTLADGPATPFRVAAFLMDMARRLLPQPEPMFPDGTPLWLQVACQEVREPEVFAAGVPAFVRLTGRSHEHVGRACQRHLGKTPSEIVNGCRLAYATRELRLSSRPVTEIALDCGYAAPAPLYRLFARSLGMSPRAYRRRHQDFRGPLAPPSRSLQGRSGRHRMRTP